MQLYDATELAYKNGEETGFFKGYKSAMKTLLLTSYWVKDNHSPWVECGRCGEGYYSMVEDYYKYCPECGAKMLGVMFKDLYAKPIHK